jgi:hypothetical protein
MVMHCSRFSVSLEAWYTAFGAHKHLKCVLTFLGGTNGRFEGSIPFSYVSRQLNHL